MEMLTSKQKVAIIVAGVFVVGIFLIYMMTKTRNNEYYYTNQISDEVVVSDEEEEVKENTEEIVIHITGAIKNEGIVKLEQGLRIADAIEKAGGLTDEADLKEVNLAYVLKDGQKVYIPKNDDTEEEEIIIQGNGSDIILDNGRDESSNTKVNINTATTQQLQTLSGIGEGIANKIIQYRNENGKFNIIDDIKNVSGIGDSKYDSIKDYICVD